MLTNSSQTKTTSIHRSWDIWEISLLTLLIIGLIGNTLIIMVMRNKRMRNTNAALFLPLMAFSDILVLLLRFLANMLKIYQVRVYNFCIIIHITPEIIALVSYWLVITTTFERTVAVLYPLKVAIIFSRKRCYIIVITLILFFVILVNTQVFCLQYYEKKPQYCAIRGPHYGKCHFYIKHVYPWFTSAFMSWLPSVTGIVFNTIIITSLYRASKKRGDIVFKNRNEIRMRSGDVERPLQSKEKQITIMLLAISVTFVVFTLPYATFELLRKLNLNIKWLKDRNAQRAVMLPIDFLHAINFFLYCLTGKKFRDVLFKIVFFNGVNRSFSRTATIIYNLKYSRRKD
jgi:hypothetical protein